MVQVDKTLENEREPLVDDTQQLHEEFWDSDVYKEYLRRSKLKSEDLPRGAAQQD